MTVVIVSRHCEFSTDFVPPWGRSDLSAHGPRQSPDAAAKAPWLFPHIRGPRSVLQDRTRGPHPAINKVPLGPLRSGKGALASASERTAGAARTTGDAPRSAGSSPGAADPENRVNCGEDKEVSQQEPDRMAAAKLTPPSSRRGVIARRGSRCFRARQPALGARSELSARMNQSESQETGSQLEWAS